MAIKQILFASLLATSVAANGAQNFVVQDIKIEAGEYSSKLPQVFRELLKFELSDE